MNLKEIMRDYLLDLDRAAKDPKRRVAWCTSVGPAEILRAMDFEVFFPENHGALLGATRTAQDAIPVANAFGYSPDICSYLTSDVGAFLEGFTPLTKAYGIDSVPRPDVLVYSTNQCSEVMHWFNFYASKLGVPIFGLHPPRHLPEVSPHHVEGMVSDFEELIAFLEGITGRGCDDGTLRRVLGLSKEATDLWNEVLELGKISPAPFTFFDAVTFMGPIVVLRGTVAARDYYAALLREMTEKARRSEAAVPGEEKRLYWDGMPIWGRLRSFSELFVRGRAAIVASTYCNSWVFPDFDADRPLESMAEAYLKIFINRSDSYKEDYIYKVAREFEINGVVFHNAKTCPNNSNVHFNLPARLRERGLRSVVIEGDLCDMRCVSDEQVTTLVEAFLEMLD